ncbi:MAG: hypothetical protein ABIO72_01735 [Patescibacteria group bacterium]
MRRSFLVIPLALSILLGVGCKKAIPANQPSTTNTTPEANVFLPPPQTPETENTRNLNELRAALLQFEQAKTFRAKLTLSIASAVVTGQIDVMKPDRFHGTMESQNASGQPDTSELVGVGDTLYIRMSKTQWGYVKDPEKAKAYTQAFRSSVSSQGSLLTQGLDDSLLVAKTRDGSLGCERYSTTIPSTSTPATLEVCVANGLPKRIVASSNGNTATVDYFDYNKLFVIERPIGFYK